MIKFSFQEIHELGPNWVVTKNSQKIEIQYQPLYDSKNKIDILYFSPTEKKKEQLKVGQPYDILGEIQINYFNNTETTQILMKDFIFHENH